MPVNLSDAAKRLGFSDNREIRGITKYLDIPLMKIGNSLVMSDEDFERILRSFGTRVNRKNGRGDK